MPEPGRERRAARRSTTPTTTGTIAASTAVTGEITLIGAMAIRLVHDRDADQPGQPAEQCRTARPVPVEVPGKNGSSAAISTAPTG